MRIVFIVLCLFMWKLPGYSQSILDAEDFLKIDSIKQRLSATTEDTGRIIIMARLSTLYRTEPDSSDKYGLQALGLAKKIGFAKGEALALDALGNQYRLEGDFPKALKTLLQALQLAEQVGDPDVTAKCLTSIGIIYSQLNDNPRAVSYFKRARAEYWSIGDQKNICQLEANISRIFRRNGQLDSATVHIAKATEYLKQNSSNSIVSWILMEAGAVSFDLGNHEAAFNYLHQSVVINEQNQDHFYGTFAFNFLAGFHRNLNNRDSTIHYARRGLAEAQQIKFKYGALEASTLLAQQNEGINVNEALHYYKLSKAIGDELYGPAIVQDLQKILLEEQERIRLAEEAKIAERNRLKQYGLLAGLAVSLLIAVILFRNYKQQKRSNAVLTKTLSELKAAQAQLIQSEKMASLGELTAGIAHEIQNPLNFVNNFSEVNSELITELEEAANTGNLDEVKAIAQDLKANEDKIRHHGKRADSIVKGMLQHSQKGSGEKELIDINVLADEYFRLAYHGLRAKDNTMNANMETNLDESIGKVQLVQQDISRVLLNLYNNAFYAVAERFKKEGSSFKPLVTLTTARTGNNINITVSDNGSGIPEQIKHKIFQPFFTTKPTGLGTGLGLSLSYDIVKAHGGTLEVESIEGVGTSFTLRLPSM
ncbi:MAG: ATP-binding protein [Chitinophagaceae bacterium]